MSQPTKGLDLESGRRDILFRLLDTHLGASPGGDDLLCELTRVYDNLRPSYSPCSKLEFGGLLLNSDEINILVQQQVQTLFPFAKPSRVLLVWKKRTAFQYMVLVRQALMQHYKCEVICHGLRTRWLSERTVVLVDNPAISISETFDNVICIDAFIGTGNTFARLHECLMSHGLPTPINLVLVDLGRVNKDYRPVFHGPYVTVDEEFWIIGFEADCLANGVEFGRSIPFMGYLVPYGTGIRKEICERYSDQFNRLLKEHEGQGFTDKRAYYGA